MQLEIRGEVAAHLKIVSPYMQVLIKRIQNCNGEKKTIRPLATKKPNLNINTSTSEAVGFEFQHLDKSRQ